MTANDMSKAIVPKSDQMNTDDLLSGPKTITVTKVAIKDSPEQPVSIFFNGDNNKPYKPCKSMSRVLVESWGADANKYIGRSMTLYRDPEVTWGGMKVGGIRISHLSDIAAAKTMALTATKQTRKPFTVKPLVSSAPAAPATPPDQAVVDAGNLAAMEGVAAYTAWLATLTPEVKATVRHLHKGWSEAAKMADAPPPETVGDVLDALPAE